MKKIVGLEGTTPGEIEAEIRKGGRFVIYPYCISLVVVTFKRFSNIYFVRAEDGHAGRIALYTLISLVLGWWGIPWGPIYTIQSIAANLGGGKIVTQEVLASLRPSPAPITPA